MLNDLEAECVDSNYGCKLMNLIQCKSMLNRSNILGKITCPYPKPVSVGGCSELDMECNTRLKFSDCAEYRNVKIICH